MLSCVLHRGRKETSGGDIFGPLQPILHTHAYISPIQRIHQYHRENPLYRSVTLLGYDIYVIYDLSLTRG